MYFLVLRHFIKSKWNNKRPPVDRLPIDSKKLIRKQKPIFSKNLVIELMILGLFPYPYLKYNITISQPRIDYDTDSINNTIDLCYNLSEFIYVFMFIRLIFLLRALFNFTPYQDDHARYYCSRNGTKANVRFSIRCMMKTHPFLIIYCFSLPSFFLFGIFLRVFERPFSDVSGLNFASYQNAVWNCAVTMSTIGFGDLYPSTLFGRIVGVLCAMLGAFMFSMIVFTFQSLLELDTQQCDAFLSIKKTRAAAKVITASLVYAVLKKKFGAESAKSKKQMKKLLTRLKKYKSTMKRLKKLYGGSEVENSVNNIQVLSQQIAVIEDKINGLTHNN